MLRTLLCCLLLLSPDSGPLAGAAATAADSLPDILQSRDSSAAQTFADNAQGDDPQLTPTCFSAVFIPDYFSRIQIRQPLTAQHLLLSAIRAPPPA